MAKKSPSARTATKRPAARTRAAAPSALSRIKTTVVTTLADVGRVALRAAGGALQAADRISAAAGRAIIDPRLMGAARAPRRPSVGAEGSTSVARKPLARSSSRSAPPTARRRGRRSA
jgi:hypothetical protein